jgi:hypothetical protein
MIDPDPPKKLPAPEYPPRGFWWKFLRLIGYPRQIIDWELFTWDEAEPPNRLDAHKLTRRELRKPPQNILQDAMEQLGTDHAAREAAIQKSTIALLAVSAYETQRATWWVQFMTFILVIGTAVLVCQTQKLLNRELAKDYKEPSHQISSPQDKAQKINSDKSPPDKVD